MRCKDTKEPQTVEQDEVVAGRNSVLEALKSGRPLNKILLAKGERTGSVREIMHLAKERGLLIQEADTAKLDKLAGDVRHQGVVALAAPVAYATVEDILRQAKEQQEAPFTVLLDGVSDPHNVGAVLRTAEATGVHGLLLPKRRSCPLTQVVAKTSAGAVEYVPVARIGNVVQTLTQLKAAGLWVVGADPAGTQEYQDIDLTGPLVIVAGSEGDGMARLTKEACDFLVRIPMRGKISSLNASVACALLLYEVFRQRRTATAALS